jgi:hypothetical protein
MGVKHVDVVNYQCVYVSTVWKLSPELQGLLCYFLSCTDFITYKQALKYLHLAYFVMLCTMKLN